MFSERLSLLCVHLPLPVYSSPSFGNYGRLPYSFHTGLSLLCFNCREIHYFICDTKPLISAGSKKKMMPQSLLLSSSEKRQKAPLFGFALPSFMPDHQQVFTDNSYPTTPVGFPPTSNFSTMASHVRVFFRIFFLCHPSERNIGSSWKGRQYENK